MKGRTSAFRIACLDRERRQLGRIAVARCVMSVQKIAQTLVGKVVGREPVPVNYTSYVNALFGIFNFLPLRQNLLKSLDFFWF